MTKKIVIAGTVVLLQACASDPLTSIKVQADSAVILPRPTPIAVTPGTTAVIAPMSIIYEDAVGGQICNPNSPTACKTQIPDYRNKYWRFELVEIPGDVRETGINKPSFSDAIWQVFKKDKTVLAQSFYLKNGAQTTEVPVSAHTFLNGNFRSEGVALKPNVLSAWSLGAKLDTEDVYIAPISSVVDTNTSQFFDLFKGALQALAVVEKNTAAAMALPVVQSSISALSGFENRLNDARNLQQQFTVLPQIVLPRYVKYIDVKVRMPDGTLSQDTLYRVKVAWRDSLYVRSSSDEVALTNILSYPLTTTATGATSVRLFAEISKAATVAEDAPVSIDQCQAIFDDAGMKGLNTQDQALVTVAWLDKNGWNRMKKKRDQSGDCYALLQPKIGAANQALLRSDEDMEKESSVNRQLQNQALGEITVIFTGENVALADKRFMEKVRVETAEENPILNDYFRANLQSEGISFTSGRLAELLKPGNGNPIVFERQSGCYHTVDKDTSSMTIETLCASIKDKEGNLQPYKLVLSLDRSLYMQPAKATIRTIRFEKLKASV
jgi:hypothetical protein